MPLLRGRRDGGGTKYRMREKMFSIGDDYWIETDSGERAFRVDGKALRIDGVTIEGKKLFITGRRFQPGAQLLLNGDPQKTANDETNPTTLLIAKKAAKRIAAGDTVSLQVRNPDGTVTDEFRFTRPLVNVNHR